MTAEETLFVVYSNTDCTEGRGSQIPIYVCSHKSTALRLGKGRYIQGTDCPVGPVTAIEVCSTWYIPISVVQVHSATPQDLEEEEKQAKQAAVIEKAQAAGMTDDDIALLRSL